VSVSISFNSTKRRAQSFIVSYAGYRFSASVALPMALYRYVYDYDYDYDHCVQLNAVLLSLA